MSRKNDKKIKQLFRRQYARTADEMAKFNSGILKPRPRWIPERVYIWLLGFFIKIKE